MRTTKTATMSLSKPKHKIGEFIYLKHDPDQIQRQIVGIIYYAMFYQYLLQCGTESTQHFEFEISDEKNILYNLN